jgi:hypothetical protein
MVRDSTPCFTEFAAGMSVQVFEKNREPRLYNRVFRGIVKV